MIDDIFVFDCVIHVVDMTRESLRTDRPDAEQSLANMLAIGDATRYPAFTAQTNFSKRWLTEEVYDLVFVQSPTDMAMAQVVPIYDWFKDFVAPVEAQYALAKAHPDRVLFCGGVDPSYRGLADALDQLEYQVRELGACSIKFYNAHVERPWRCDDEKIAYPIYEKCRSLGIKVIQFHKGLPFGTQNMEQLRPNDLQAPARDFPDMTFIIHHLAVPYFDEVVNIASRFPNIVLALSGNLNMLILAPRLVQEQVGRLLMEVGVDKLIWGSEAAMAGSPGPYLDAFMQLEIPTDLRDGYGYPQITREDKERILGLNFASIMGIDLDRKRREFAQAAVESPSGEPR